MTSRHHQAFGGGLFVDLTRPFGRTVELQARGALESLCQRPELQADVLPSSSLHPQQQDVDDVCSSSSSTSSDDERNVGTKTDWRRRRSKRKAEGTSRPTPNPNFNPEAAALALSLTAFVEDNVTSLASFNTHFTDFVEELIPAPPTTQRMWQTQPHGDGDGPLRAKRDVESPATPKRKTNSRKELLSSVSRPSDGGGDRRKPIAAVPQSPKSPSKVRASLGPLLNRTCSMAALGTSASACGTASALGAPSPTTPPPASSSPTPAPIEPPGEVAASSAAISSPRDCDTTASAAAVSAVTDPATRVHLALKKQEAGAAADAEGDGARPISFAGTVRKLLPIFRVQRLTEERKKKTGGATTSRKSELERPPPDRATKWLGLLVWIRQFSVLYMREMAVIYNWIRSASVYWRWAYAHPGRHIFHLMLCSAEPWQRVWRDAGYRTSTTVATPSQHHHNRRGRHSKDESNNPHHHVSLSDWGRLNACKTLSRLEHAEEWLVGSIGQIHSALHSHTASLESMLISLVDTYHSIGATINGSDGLLSSNNNNNSVSNSMSISDDVDSSASLSSSGKFVDSSDVEVKQRKNQPTARHGLARQGKDRVDDGMILPPEFDLAQELSAVAVNALLGMRPAPATRRAATTAPVATTAAAMSATAARTGANAKQSSDGARATKNVRIHSDNHGMAASLIQKMESKQKSNSILATTDDDEVDEEQQLAATSGDGRWHSLHDDSATLKSSSGRGRKHSRGHEEDSDGDGDTTEGGSPQIDDVTPEIILRPPHDRSRDDAGNLVREPSLLEVPQADTLFLLHNTSGSHSDHAAAAATSGAGHMMHRSVSGGGASATLLNTTGGTTSTMSSTNNVDETTLPPATSTTSLHHDLHHHDSASMTDDDVDHRDQRQQKKRRKGREKDTHRSAAPFVTAASAWEANEQRNHRKFLDACESLIRLARISQEWTSKWKESLCNRDKPPAGRHWWTVTKVGMVFLPTARFLLHNPSTALVSAKATSGFNFIVEKLQEYVTIPTIELWRSLTQTRGPLEARRLQLDEEAKAMARMVEVYHSDCYEDVSQEEAREFYQRAYEHGDFGEVTAHYEQAVRHPIRSFFFGHIVRLLLMQLQAQTLELSRVMLSSEEVLASNDFNFKVTALAPVGMLLALLLYFSVRGRREKQRPVVIRLSQCWRSLHRIISSSSCSGSKHRRASALSDGRMLASSTTIHHASSVGSGSQSPVQHPYRPNHKQPQHHLGSPYWSGGSGGGGGAGGAAGNDALSASVRHGYVLLLLHEMRGLCAQLSQDPNADRSAWSSQHLFSSLPGPVNALASITFSVVMLPWTIVSKLFGALTVVARGAGSSAATVGFRGGGGTSAMGEFAAIGSASGGIGGASYSSYYNPASSGGGSGLGGSGCYSRIDELLEDLDDFEASWYSRAKQMQVLDRMYKVHKFLRDPSRGL